MKASFCLNVLFCLVAHVGYVLSFEIRHIGPVAKSLGMLRPWVACPKSVRQLHQLLMYGVDGRPILTFTKDLNSLIATGERHLLENVDLIVCMEDYAVSGTETKVLTSLLDSSSRNSVVSTWLFGETKYHDKCSRQTKYEQDIFELNTTFFQFHQVILQAS